MSEKSKKSILLNSPIKPFLVEPNLDANEILRRMEKISFQGRNLAIARKVWNSMLEDNVLIFLGIAGALSAGGLRLLIAYLIKHRYIDCLVSTGANLYHDLHETRGRNHFIGSPNTDDQLLQTEHIDRVYDTFVDENEFIDNDIWISNFATTLESRNYTTREFLYLLGKKLWQETSRDGILTAAFRANVPIFCPAISDSSIGMGLSQARHKDPQKGQIDVIGDIAESANLVIRRRPTASIVFGGGTPKNFINQAAVQAEFYKPGGEGHRYALQIITDPPHFGGASGSTLDEAKSWGKVSGNAERVTVYSDVTLALPLLASALASTAQERLKTRRAAKFLLESPIISVDGTPLPENDYETFKND